jgi:hypothetical protein
MCLKFINVLAWICGVILWFLCLSFEFQEKDLASCLSCSFAHALHFFSSVVRLRPSSTSPSCTGGYLRLGRHDGRVRSSPMGPWVRTGSGVSCPEVHGRTAPCCFIDIPPVPFHMEVHFEVDLEMCARF